MKAIDFELRILSGLHEGARVFLSDQLSVGGTLEHEVFLRDPGFSQLSGAIQLTEQGWIWVNNGAGPQGSANFGEMRRIGGIAVTVDRDDAPWPKQIDSSDTPDIEQPVPVEENNPQSEESLHPAVPAEQDSVEPPLMPSSAPAANISSRRSTAITAALIAGGLVFGFLLVAAWLFLRPPPSELGPTPTETALDPATLVAYQTVLADLNLENEVRVRPDEDGVRLVGIVENDGTLEALSNRLASFDPRPAMSIMTTEELKLVANATVQRFSPRLQVACRGAQCALTGAALTEESVKSAASALINEVPAISAVSQDVALPDDVARQFVNALEKKGLHGFKSSWDGNELAIVGPMNSDQHTELMIELGKLAEQTKDLIPFRLTINELQTTPEQVASAGRPPFDIVAVVGGSFPYVTTSSGENVLLGSSFMGYRLVQIRPREVIFDGPRMLTFKR